MCKCENVQMCKCENVQMCKCANVQICKCANVRMCKWSPLFATFEDTIHYKSFTHFPCIRTFPYIP